MTTAGLVRPARAHRYVRAPVPLHFPSEGAVPLRLPSDEAVPETALHLHLRTALFLILYRRLGERACVGSDQFVYWDPTDPGACLAPDAFVRIGGPLEPLASYKVWEHGAPHVAVEIVSASDRGERDWTDKLERCRRCGVSEVVRFDPEDERAPLRLWDLVEGDLVERDRADPEATRCDALGGYWFVEGDPKLGPMLRLAGHPDGTDRWLTPIEAEQAERSEKEAALRRVAELEAELRRGR